MPARLRGINSGLSSRRRRKSSSKNKNKSSSIKQSKSTLSSKSSGRKSVSNAIASLTLSRRSTSSNNKYSIPSSPSTTSSNVSSPRHRRLSQKALAVLDDGDTSDGNVYKQQSRKAMRHSHTTSHGHVQQQQHSYQMKQLLHTPVSPSVNSSELQCSPGLTPNGYGGDDNNMVSSPNRMITNTNTTGYGYNTPVGSPSTPNSYTIMMTQNLYGTNNIVSSFPHDDYDDDDSTRTPDEEDRYQLPRTSISCDYQYHNNNSTGGGLMSGGMNSDEIRKTTSYSSSTINTPLNDLYPQLPYDVHPQLGQQQQNGYEKEQYEEDDEEQSDANLQTSSSVDPPEVNQDQDTYIQTGNEALLFIYGHNPNLYTSVFNIPPSSLQPDGTPKTTSSSIDNIDLLDGGGKQESVTYDADYLVQLEDAIELSYNQQNQQLKKALSCPSNHISAAAMLCGYNDFKNKKGSEYMNETMFLNIKLDALSRAYDILKEEDTREEYDNLYRNSRGVNGEEGTVKTEELTNDTTSEQHGGEWNNEEQFIYGKHGDYSYDDEDDDSYHSGDDEQSHASSYASRASSYDPEEDEEEGEDDEEGQHYGGRDDDSSSKLQYSYHSPRGFEEDEDDFEEYQDGPQVPLDQAGSQVNHGLYEPQGYYEESAQDRASQVATANKSKGLEPQEQYSPTDPMEFDQLIQHSLDDEEYFNQFTSTPGSPAPQEEEEAFDPFNLNGADALSPLTDDGTEFPKVEISKSVEFVCPLPSHANDFNDKGNGRHEMTMGELLEQQQADGWPVLDMSVVSDYTDGESKADESLSYSDSVGSRSKSGRRKKMKKVKNKVKHLMASFSGSVASVKSFDTQSLEEVQLTPVENGVGDSYYQQSSNQTLKGQKQNFKTRGSDPDGPNMSMDDDAIKDEAEIATFLSIASTFNSMSAINNHHSENLIQTELSNSEEEMVGGTSGGCTQLVPMKSKSIDETDEGLDCFQAKDGTGPVVRFNMKDEDEYSAISDPSGVLNCGVLPYVDACLDGVGETLDNALTSVERFCGYKDLTRGL